MSIEAIPITLREANEFVANYHRHSGRTSRDGGKFAIGATDGTRLVGIAIVGRPISRVIGADIYTAEVLRTCTIPSPPKGTNSFLYAACWRAWRAMGGKKLITYTLMTEGGASLRGAGWKIIAISKGHKKGWTSTSRAREWRPIYGQDKFRWEIT